MSSTRKTLLAQAAELRAVGFPWEQVAQKVGRKIKTCQNWPIRYRAEWEELYRSVEDRRYQETCKEAHTHLINLMRDPDKKVKQKAVDSWHKYGVAAYSRATGNMVLPAPAAPDKPPHPNDKLFAELRECGDAAREQIDKRRAHEGKPPATDDEFAAEWTAETEAATKPYVWPEYDCDGDPTGPEEPDDEEDPMGLVPWTPERAERERAAMEKAQRKILERRQAAAETARDKLPQPPPPAWPANGTTMGLLLLAAAMLGQRTVDVNAPTGPEYAHVLPADAGRREVRRAVWNGETREMVSPGRSADDLVAPRALGRVQVLVRPAHQLPGRGRSVQGALGRAQADRQVEHLVVEPKRVLLDQRPDPLGRGQGVLLAGLDQHQGELLAAVAREQVLAAHHLLDAPGQLAQGEVAAQVPELVVDPLEPVDVHQHQRQRPGVPDGPQDFALEELVEVPGVGDLGQGVDDRQPVDLLVVVGLDVAAGQVAEDAIADAQVVAVAHRDRVAGERLLVVHIRAVGALHVEDEELLADLLNADVAAADGSVEDADVAVFAAADNERLFAEGVPHAHPWPSRINVDQARLPVGGDGGLVRPLDDGIDQFFHASGTAGVGPLARQRGRKGMAEPKRHWLHHLTPF